MPHTDRKIVILATEDLRTFYVAGLSHDNAYVFFKFRPSAKRRADEVYGAFSSLGQFPQCFHDEADALKYVPVLKAKMKELKHTVDEVARIDSDGDQRWNVTRDYKIH